MVPLRRNSGGTACVGVYSGEDDDEIVRGEAMAKVCFSDEEPVLRRV